MTSAVLDETPYIFNGSRIEFDTEGYDGFPEATDAERAEYENRAASCFAQIESSDGEGSWHCSRNEDHSGPHVGMSDDLEDGVIVVARWFDEGYVYIIDEDEL